MEMLILFAIAGIAAIFAGSYVQRKQMKQDYAEYMANRITFDTSEMNSND